MFDIAVFLLLVPVVALLGWMFVPAVLSGEHARRRFSVRRQEPPRSSGERDEPVPSHLPAPPLPPDQE
jgi:hypothetical protein